MNFVDFYSKSRAELWLLRTGSLQRMRRLRALSRRPVIIGGCGRSGTSLLLSILSCHPHLFAIDRETVALCPDGYGADGMYNRSPNLDTPLEIWKIYSLLNDMDISGHYTRWCEKTPRNVIYFRRILRYYGDKVRLIHILRDGRDVVTSRHPLKPDAFWTTPDRWVRDVTAGLALAEHPQCLTVRYEQLLSEYELTMRQICEFLDEPFSDRFLDYPNTASLQKALAWKETARPLSTASVGKWRRPEFRDRLDVFWREPGAPELMKQLGYARESST